MPRETLTLTGTLLAQMAKACGSFLRLLWGHALDSAGSEAGVKARLACARLATILLRFDAVHDASFFEVQGNFCCTSCARWPRVS